MAHIGKVSLGNILNSIDMQVPSWTYSHFHFLSISLIVYICIDKLTEYNTNDKEINKSS